MKTTKKVFTTESAIERFLLTNFWGDDQYFGGLKPRTSFQRHRARYLFRAQSSLGGHNSRLGGHGPAMPLYGAEPALKLCETLLYSQLNITHVSQWLILGCEIFFFCRTFVAGKISPVGQYYSVYCKFMLSKFWIFTTTILLKNLFTCW